MTRTVDLVVVGAHPAALAATLEAARGGWRVLVVIRSRRPPRVACLRRSVRAAGIDERRQLSVLTGADVVCADGIQAVEAVVIRRIRTGALIAVNASAIVAFTRADPPRHPLSSRPLARAVVLPFNRAQARDSVRRLLTGMP